METKQLGGIIPPMVTPFTETEELDTEALRREARFLMDREIDGISVGGSTGEGVTLSNDEIKTILGVVTEENRKAIPVIAGVIKNTTREAIETARAAKESGADALLVTPAFYHGASDKGNYRYYEMIAGEAGLPVIVYNVVPNNQITSALMLKISGIENVVGVKQVGAEALAEMFAVCSPATRVFSACDEMLYSTYVSGACGAIAAILTAVPDLCIEQWQAFRRGDQERAMEIHARLLHVFRAYFDCKPFVGKIKEVINQLGRPVGRARAPVQEPDEKRKLFIRQNLKKAGMITDL